MYHKLMNGMPAWTPEQIGRLTPLQVMCMAKKEPPRPSMSDETDYAEVLRQQQEAWKD